MRLLLIEDHQELATWVTHSLRDAGFVVDHLARGDHALHAAQTEDYDLMILDLSLPGMKGIEVLQKLRSSRHRSQLPIIILTASDSIEERVHGLNCGADDYLVKPIEMAELEARVRALIRRSTRSSPIISIGNLNFDTVTRLVSINNEPVPLTRREQAVLENLISRLNRPVAKSQLFEKVFDFDSVARPESIEIYIHRLRKKLEGSGVSITTMRGLGYILHDTDNSHGT